MSEPRAPRSTATLTLLGTFVLGMIAGAALLHIAIRTIGPRGPFPGGPPPPPPVEHLTQVLGLSPDQVGRLREILEDGRGRMRREADATRERIREILSEEQRRRFDAMPPPFPPPGRRGFPPPPPPGPPGPPGPPEFEGGDPRSG